MLEIQTGKDNKILRQKSEAIKTFDKKLKNLVKEMLKTVIKNNGLGLAGPQVGENKRLFVAKIKNQFVTMINPEIIEFSEEKEVGEEGCLSLPDIWGDVERSKNVTVKFQDIKCDIHILKLKNLEAREILHEYDHLEGILFIDKLHNPINITNIHDFKNNLPRL